MPGLDLLLALTSSDVPLARRFLKAKVKAKEKAKVKVPAVLVARFVVLVPFPRFSDKAFLVPFSRSLF